MLEELPVDDRVANVNIEEYQVPCMMKALVVQWNAEADVFTFMLNVPLKKMTMLHRWHMQQSVICGTSMGMGEKVMCDLWQRKRKLHPTEQQVFLG